MLDEPLNVAEAVDRAQVVGEKFVTAVAPCYGTHGASEAAVTHTFDYSRSVRQARRGHHPPHACAGLMPAPQGLERLAVRQAPSLGALGAGVEAHTQDVAQPPVLRQPDGGPGCTLFAQATERRRLGVWFFTPQVTDILAPATVG